jgi:hypothetical protein
MLHNLAVYNVPNESCICFSAQALDKLNANTQVQTYSSIILQVACCSHLALIRTTFTTERENPYLLNLSSLVFQQAAAVSETQKSGKTPETSCVPPLPSSATGKKFCAHRLLRWWGETVTVL